MNQSNSLLRETFILTIAALITKILSAVYRVPFQNIVGDVGFYIYQQVYPFYGLALSLATYGFPVVISKLYIEYGQRNERNEIRKLMIISGSLLSLFGFFLFLFTYLGANWLALQMNDLKLSFLLKVISFIFLLFPIVSIFRGFFQGKGNMVPTAVSQVSEQLIRVATILIASPFLIYHGYSLYVVGGGAFFGSIAGSLVAMLVLLTIWVYKEGKSDIHDWQILKNIKFKEIKFIGKVLMIEGLAVSISSLLLILLQLADSLNLYSLLIQLGIDREEAKGLKGIYDRGQPLIQLGTILATSMSLSLVPMITNEKLTNNIEFLIDKIRLSLKMSVFIGIGATVGLYSIIKPTNIMLFENVQGSDVLSLITLLIFFGSIIMTLSAILQGLGNTLYPAIIIIIGFSLKYGLNMLFVPIYHTFGAALASVLSFALISILLYRRLKKYFIQAIIDTRLYIQIGVSAICMKLVLDTYLLLTDFIYIFGHDRMAATAQALSAVVIGGFVFLWVAIKGNVFKEEELYLLPFGSKLIWLLPKGKRSDLRE
ncbi:putative polysaccharide biosynthesis protein [Bacillus massilinigeriensis]|uniref:putative polysaccharide biosynthesis protein n=1 Tax=Bacillus massilionigeriensis TaxID=1805475 RepID=UPI000AC53267|nr:polysaccharide biosynthesis protein [Bacillus massilionigeriensis]